MVGGHEEGTRFGEHDGSHGDGRVFDGRLGDHQVDVLALQGHDGRVVRHFLQLDGAVRVARVEYVGRPDDEVTGPRRGESDAQHTGRAPAGCCRVGDGLLDPLVCGKQFGVELAADRGECHTTAVAFEQRAPDAGVPAS